MNISADDAVNREPGQAQRQRFERAEAVAFLQEVLAAGPQLAKDLQEQARESEGIAKRTLDRAKKELCVVAFHPENPGPWWWRLPRDDPHRQTPPPNPQGEKGGALAICPDANEKCDSSAGSSGTPTHCHNASSLGGTVNGAHTGHATPTADLDHMNSTHP